MLGFNLCVVCFQCVVCAFCSVFMTVDIWMWRKDYQNIIHFKYNNDRALQCPDPRASIIDEGEDSGIKMTRLDSPLITTTICLPTAH